MIEHFIVCPNKQTIFNSMEGESIVPVLSCLDDIPEMAKHVKEANAHLHCVIVRSVLPLSMQNFTEELKDAPIALYVGTVGNISEVIAQMGLLKELNIRIYLPLDRENNFSVIRILSSLGIETAASFDATVDWERLADLMSYAFYGQMAHASIAPFNYLADRYNRIHRNDYSAVYFNDPTTYLHVDESGHVALTNEDLESGHYVSDSICDIDELNEMVAYQEKINEWHKFFLKQDGCAYCPSWRICLGKYESNNTDEVEYGCKDFFAEFYTAIEEFKSLKLSVGQKWQP